MMDYLRDPKSIYAQSFETIRAEADLSHLPPTAHGIAARIIHACGMTDIADDLRVTADFAAAANAALQAGKSLIVDSEMVRHGIIARQLPKGVEIVCTLNDPRARDIGVARQTTRSAAAVELWAPYLGGAVVAIGNAPTALFAVLEAIDAGGPRPVAIAAFPVGFVGAAESKGELIRDPRGIAYATLPGRRGGSAMAAAAINALAGDNS